MNFNPSSVRFARVARLPLFLLAPLVVSQLLSATTAVSQQPAVAPQPVVALAVLRSTDSVLRAMTSVVYDIHRINWNIDGSNRSDSARIFLSRHAIDDSVGFKLRYESDHNVIAYDGARIIWLDHEAKKVVQLNESLTMADYLDGNHIGSLVERIISTTRPFEKLADVATLEAPVEIAGVPSAAVRVHNEATEDFTQPLLLWCFGLADHFPRRYEFSGLYKGMLYADTLTFSNVRLNVTLDDSLFTIETPENYEFEIQKPYVAPEIIADGSPLPEFELAHTRGGTITPEDLRGKVVVLDFWYISCAPCLEAMPKLSALQKRYGTDSVIVLGVNVRDSLDRVTKLLTSRGFAYESLLGGNDLATEMRITGYPTLFVIGRDGTIARSIVGTSDELEAQLAAIIEEALAGR